MPEPIAGSSDHSQWARLSDFIMCVTYVSFVTYLHDSILIKVYLASMVVECETDFLLFAHRVTEFA